MISEGVDLQKVYLFVCAQDMFTFLVYDDSSK